MLTEDDIATALIAALAPLAAALETGSIERKHAHHPDRHALEFHYLEMRDDDLLLTFYFAARLKEIQPGVAILTQTGPERLSFDSVKQWLGEPAQAYMFDTDNLDAACSRVADLTRRLILRYRQDPAAALPEMHAIDDERADRFLISEDRREANAARARQDFALASRLYENLADHLTPVERKRLDTARTNGP